MLLMFASLTMGQPYDCPSASEMIPKGMENNNHYITMIQHMRAQNFRVKQSTDHVYNLANLAKMIHSLVQSQTAITYDHIQRD